MHDVQKTQKHTMKLQRSSTKTGNKWVKENKRERCNVPAREKNAFWVSEGLSEHNYTGSQRHNSQWVEMSNIGLTTKVLVLRHIA